MTADEQTERETAWREWRDGNHGKNFSYRERFDAGWDAARLAPPAPQVTREQAKWTAWEVLEDRLTEGPTFDLNDMADSKAMHALMEEVADAILALLTGESDAVTVEPVLDEYPLVGVSGTRYALGDFWQLESKTFAPRTELGYSGNPADYPHTNNEKGK